MIGLFILSLLILFIIPPRFRLYTLGALILLALGGFLLSRPGGEEAGGVRNLIPIEQVKIVQIDLHPSHGVGYELVGKVLNHSSYTLLGLGIDLLIKDCVGGDEKSQSLCATLAKVQVPVRLSIPPKKAGEFNKRLYFKELHPKGRIRWEYTIRYTEARKGEGWLSFVG